MSFDDANLQDGRVIGVVSIPLEQGNVFRRRPTKKKRKF